MMVTGDSLLSDDKSYEMQMSIVDDREQGVKALFVECKTR